MPRPRDFTFAILEGQCGQGVGAWSLRSILVGKHFLVLCYYSLLDHASRFSVNRKGNIPLTALALRPIGK
jgi:hypothetical protein